MIGRPIIAQLGISLGLTVCELKVTAFVLSQFKLFALLPCDDTLHELGSLHVS